MAHALLPIAVLTLIWGCNWPVLKIGVTEIAPLTFRSLTLPFAALGMFAVARWSGESIAHSARVVGPRRDPRVLQHRGLERLRAVRRAAAARGPQRDPRLHDADLGHADRDRSCCTSRSSRARSSACCWACRHGRCCWATTSATSDPTPIGALLILIAAISWACGTVLLRKWKPPFAQNTLSGWMMLLGWLPLAMLAPFFDPHPPSYLTHAVGQGVVRDRLQHLPRRNDRALGVVHARAHAAGGGVVVVVAAGAGRRRVRRHAVPGRTSRRRRIHRAGAGAGVAVFGAVPADAGKPVTAATGRPASRKRSSPGRFHGAEPVGTDSQSGG